MGKLNPKTKVKIEDLVCTKDAVKILHTSSRFLAKLRCLNSGPPYIKIPGCRPLYHVPSLLAYVIEHEKDPMNLERTRYKKRNRHLESYIRYLKTKANHIMEKDSCYPELVDFLKEIIHGTEQIKNPGSDLYFTEGE